MKKIPLSSSLTGRVLQSVETSSRRVTSDAASPKTHALSQLV